MDKPLVTIAIITYNSAQTVIETLDSVFVQNYPNIELIISDDCSLDETMDLCNRWITEHGSRFSACKIKEVAKNTGITANCNRAIAEAQGDYLKLLAGDDLLKSNAISEYVRYMLDNPQAIYVFSRVTVFGDNQNVINTFTNKIFDYSFFSLTKKEQYEWLIGKWFQPIPAASAFVNITNAINAGVLYYDERIPMLEDWPKWIVLSKNSIDFHFIDKPLACYRVTDNSVCSGEKNKAVFYKSKALLYLYYQFKPTIRLFGIRRAFTLYIKAMASLKGSYWGILNKLVTKIIIVRDKLLKRQIHLLQ